MPHTTRGFGLLEGLLTRWRAQKANALIPAESRTGRILDIGCGAYPYFLVHTEFSEKFGIDQIINPNKSVTGISLVDLDLEVEPSTPYNDEYFDVVTMLAVFEHIKLNELINILREIRRILKPEGRLILTTPAAWSGPVLDIMAQLRLVSSDEIEEHEKTYSVKEIKDILVRGGFLPANIKTGYFEGFFGIWASVVK